MIQRFAEIPNEVPPMNTELMYIAGAKDGKYKIANDDGESSHLYLK